jgi:hypothetical protein
MIHSRLVEQSRRHAALERMDALLREGAISLGAFETAFPVLVPMSTVRTAECDKAFPHLLMAPGRARDPIAGFDPQDQVCMESCLSPAVCHHVFASLEGSEVGEGIVLTARGRCFRNEEPSALEPGRRQIEFQMREVVVVGTPAWVASRAAAWAPAVDRIAATLGLATRWQPASDPFFLPAAQGKARLQRLLGTKEELCLPDSLAIASLNRHGSFFGARFRIATADGAPAHSACLAFGLDRWAASPAADPRTAHPARR